MQMISLIVHGHWLTGALLVPNQLPTHAMRHFTKQQQSHKAEHVSDQRGCGVLEVKRERTFSWKILFLLKIFSKRLRIVTNSPFVSHLQYSHPNWHFHKFLVVLNFLLGCQEKKAQRTSSLKDSLPQNMTNHDIFNNFAKYEPLKSSQSLKLFANCVSSSSFDDSLKPNSST